MLSVRAKNLPHTILGNHFSPQNSRSALWETFRIRIEADSDPGSGSALQPTRIIFNVSVVEPEPPFLAGAVKKGVAPAPAQGPAMTPCLKKR